MERANTIFLKGQLEKSVKKLISIMDFSIPDGGLNNIKYVIEFDKEETQELKTNMDYIKFAHIEKLQGQEMDLEEVCDTLITGKNEMPLWVKISLVDENRIFKLIISKRFRKKRDIEDWHKTSEFLPVIIIGLEK
jgi:hypothetical protein